MVGLQPIKSAEQIGPMFVFFGLNVIGYGEMLIRKQKLQGDRKKAWQLRIRVYTDRRLRPPSPGANRVVRVVIRARSRFVY